MLNVEPTECLQRLSDSVVAAAGPLYDKEHFTCPAWVDTLPEEERKAKKEMCEQYGSPNVFAAFSPQSGPGD